jgi:hypothetical protein
MPPRTDGPWQGSQLTRNGVDVSEVRAAMAHMRKRVIKALRGHGAYLFHSAATGSQYVKFSDPRIGSLRVADHTGREKYRYKWNLIHGGKRGTEYEGSVKREYYGFEDVEQFLLDIELAQADLEQRLGVYDPLKDPYRDQRIRHKDQLEGK